MNPAPIFLGLASVLKGLQCSIYSGYESCEATDAKLCGVHHFFN